MNRSGILGFTTLFLAAIMYQHSVQAQSVKVLSDVDFDEAIKRVNKDAILADWIVMFCDFTLSNKCKNLHTKVEELAENLEGDVQVAKVNVHDSIGLKQRFQIGYQEVPFVTAIKDGKYYLYKGDINVTNYEEFAKGDYLEAERQNYVPVHPTLHNEFWSLFYDDIKHKGGFLHMILMVDNDTGRPQISGLLLVYVLPVATFYIFYLIIHSSFSDDPDLRQRVREMQTERVAIVTKRRMNSERGQAELRRRREARRQEIKMIIEMQRLQNQQEQESENNRNTTLDNQTEEDDLIHAKND